jgi:transposase
LQPLEGDPEAPNHGISGRIIKACLEQHLPTIVRRGTYFMQDNAPVHRSRKVQEWLIPWLEERHAIWVDWPPYSPDLNPIENLWKLLKERIIKAHPTLKSMPNSTEAFKLLEKTAQEVWVQFADELLDKLVESMRGRLEAVVRNKGWHTKY